jgi:hypothetical protein
MLDLAHTIPYERQACCGSRPFATMLEAKVARRDRRTELNWN